MLIKEKLETPQIVRLRYRYEPYSRYNITCRYDSIKGEFILEWSSGDFNMTIKAKSLTVVANNLSSFNISGTVETLTIGFYAGLCEFKGTDLVAQHVKIFQRSSHDITVNPQQSLSVDIRSVGDVISVQRPPVVELEQYYTGQLLFLD